MKGLEAIDRHRLIPVATIDDPAAAGGVADALRNGGLPMVEITLRSQAALDVIAAMAAHDDLTVGAGTVLTVDQVRQARRAGARFIVSPGIDTEVVHYCRRSHIPVLPGVSTPTEIQTALSCGCDIVKYFPAEAFGGPATLKAVAAPFTTVRFVPTGGITPDNLGAYLRLPQVAACGSSWPVAGDLIRDGRFDVIRQRVRQAVTIVNQIGEAPF